MPASTPGKLKYQAAYNARPVNVAKRVQNNQARAVAIKSGKVSVGDKKDVAHKIALSNGGSNSPHNTMVQDREFNRAWRKGESGYKVPNTGGAR